jgi:hypothetical protein
MREIEAISYLVGLDPEPNGSNFNWFAMTHSGIPLSLYYEVNRKPCDLHWVEVMDSKGILGLPTDQDGLVGIDIKDLPKYFKQGR